MILWCLLAVLFFSSCKQTNQPYKVTFNDTIQWQVNPNGTYDLVAGDLEIVGFRPAVNGSPLAYSNVSVEPGRNNIKILYRLIEGGKIEIDLGKDASGLLIDSKITGLETAPADFSPLAFGQVKGANRFFKQGLGFGGPSGVYPIPKAPTRIDKTSIFENAWSYDSYMTFGLFAANNSSLAMGVYDNRDFLFRTVFYSKQHRFGLVDRWNERDEALVDASFSTEMIPLKDKNLVLPSIHIISGDKPFQTMQSLAKGIAGFNQIRLDQKAAYHWCSWYEHHEHISESMLNEFIGKLPLLNPSPEIQTVQIDDGYCTRGDWLIPNERFPSGLESLIKKVSDQGYRAGIWVGPFMVSQNSEVYKNHPDWLLKNSDGSLFYDGVFPENDTTYVLDSSHPEAFEYLRTVFRTFRKMGVTYYKTDFLDWGFRNSMHWKRHTPGKTSAQYLTDVLTMIREEIGEESMWLGCIAPFPPLVGFVDAVRVAYDVGSGWNEVTHNNMINETEANQYFNNILWQNDPDVLYLDGFKTSYSDNEKQSLILWNGLLGGIVNTSDRFHLVSNEYLDWWKFIKPGEKPVNADFPFWGKQFDVKVMSKPLAGGGYALFLLNDQGKEQFATVKISDVLGFQKAFVFDWQPGRSNGLGEKDALEVTLAPHQSRLFYISAENKAPGNRLVF